MTSACIIIPCYNEKARLPTQDFLNFLSRTPNVNFCFVDDGSTDGTSTLLEDLQAQYPKQIKALILPKNQGKAHAVRAGMLHCKDTPVDHIGFFDADLATPLEAIADLVDTLDKSPMLDLVMGSRMKHLGTDINRNPFRHYAGRVVATAISQILRIPVYDTQCGAKLFRRRAVADLFQQPFISPWLFDVELLARLIRQHGRDAVLYYVAEQPLREWTEKYDSRIRPIYYVKLWFDLYRIHRTYTN